MALGPLLRYRGYADTGGGGAGGRGWAGPEYRHNQRASWAFAALTAPPGARAHYDRRKADGDRHAAAQRNLSGRLLGCLHHCLATRQHYDEKTAFPAPTPTANAKAA